MQYILQVTFKQHWWYCYKHLQKHESRLQLSYIECFDPLLSTLHGGERGGGSSSFCSSTTRSSRMTSAVRPSLLIVILPSLPVTPSAGNSHHSDCAKNPLHLIFTGKFHVLHPLSLHSARSLLYLAVVMV